MPPKIVVAAVQRSGSTMICDDMTRTGVLGRPEEWFLSWQSRSGCDWSAELEAVRQRGTTDNGVFAVKLMANQLAGTDRRLATFLPAARGTHPHLLRFLNSEETTWVWVRRRDTLAQAISHYLAKQSGVYHIRKSNAGFLPGAAVFEPTFREKTAGEPPYDFAAILREWHILAQHEMVWQQFFDLNAIAPTVFWYEDLVALDAGPVIASLVRLARPDGDPSKRNIAKLPPERNDTIRARFLADLFRAH